MNASVAEFSQSTTIKQECNRQMARAEATVRAASDIPTVRISRIVGSYCRFDVVEERTLNMLE